MTSVQGVRAAFSSAGATDPGLQRDVNEDRYHDDPGNEGGDRISGGVLDVRGWLAGLGGLAHREHTDVFEDGAPLVQVG